MTRIIKRTVVTEVTVITAYDVYAQLDHLLYKNKWKDKSIANFYGPSDSNRHRLFENNGNIGACLSGRILASLGITGTLLRELAPSGENKPTNSIAMATQRLNNSGKYLLTTEAILLLGTVERGNDAGGTWGEILAQVNTILSAFEALRITAGSMSEASDEYKELIKL